MSSSEQTTISSIIGLWPNPSLDAFVSSVNEHIPDQKLHINKDRVYKWMQRDAIPQEYWYPVTQAGKANGYQVTPELLAQHAWNKKVLAA